VTQYRFGAVVLATAFALTVGACGSSSKPAASVTSSSTPASTAPASITAARTTTTPAPTTQSNLVTASGVIQAPGDYASGCQSTTLRTAAGKLVSLGQDVETFGFGVPNIPVRSAAGVGAIVDRHGKAVAKVGDKVTIQGELFGTGPGSDMSCRLSTKFILVAKVTKG